jgi:hypothetical protein
LVKVSFHNRTIGGCAATPALKQKNLSLIMADSKARLDPFTRPQQAL